MKLLLVEDEVQLSEALTQILIKNKYQVDNAYDGISGFELALTKSYDLIILDINLPKLNGFDVLKKLRKEKIAIPVILLTARSSTSDKVLGLDLGADDYLTKPFSPEELLARLRALSRRNPDYINEDIIEFSDIKLNISTFELVKDSNSIQLMLKEFEIMKYFMQRPRIVVTKDELLIKVWGYDSDAEYNNLEVYISFLRKKLNYIGSLISITTVRGIGYKLEISNV